MLRPIATFHKQVAYEKANARWNTIKSKDEMLIKAEICELRATKSVAKAQQDFVWAKFFNKPTSQVTPTTTATATTTTTAATATTATTTTNSTYTSTPTSTSNNDKKRPGQTNVRDKLNMLNDELAELSAGILSEARLKRKTQILAERKQLQKKVSLIFCNFFCIKLFVFVANQNGR